MATDYDSPRTSDDDLDADSIEALQSRRTETAVGLADLEETDNESLELPGADLSNEELTVRVLPRQADEFTCSSCFLVQHRSQLSARRAPAQVCLDCA